LTTTAPIETECLLVEVSDVTGGRMERGAIVAEVAERFGRLEAPVLLTRTPAVSDGRGVIPEEPPTCIDTGNPCCARIDPETLYG
jgi:hypothetical protein